MKFERIFVMVLFLFGKMGMVTINDQCSNTEITIRKSNRGPVAFTAEMANAYTSTIDNEKIIFANVITNVGDAYNPADGVFTAPYDGLYIFDWTVVTDPTKVFDSMIVVNGEEKGRNAADTGGGNSYMSGSSLVTVELSTGDRVFIQKFGSLGNLIRERWSSFSGWMV